MEELQLVSDPVLRRDLEEIADSDMISWERFREKTILVTGATGLIGSQTVLALVLAGQKRKLNLTVLALVRNLEKAEKMLGGCLGKGLKLVKGDVTALPRISEKIDYILHGAGVTASRQFVEQPVETILTTLKGTEAMLELAKSHRAEGMVYLSSMEAYGVVDPERFEVRGNGLWIYRSPGSTQQLFGKQAYGGGALRRLRPGISGAGEKRQVGPNLRRGHSQKRKPGIRQFARSILKGEDLVLHTDGSKAHCYCYTSDAVLGLLKILLEGEPGQAYNVSNENTFSSIRQMAQMLVDAYPKSGSRLVFDIPRDANLYGYAPASRMLVNSEKLRALGWSPRVDLPEMYQRLMESMKGWEEFSEKKES